MIACVLTILGYSINDTIVVFDRIRENMKAVEKVTRENLEDICNASLTQTLSRSINTSITTFIMVLFLFILGVPAIQEFAIPLMVGVVCGSYSSIFIATQLWYVMKIRAMKRESLNDEKNCELMER
jgi:SecD/SecF fusion protein